MEPLPEERDVCWHCPLPKRTIPQGLCVDINLQRLQLFKPDVLRETQRETDKTVEEISKVCEACPNQPFREA